MNTKYLASISLFIMFCGFIGTLLLPQSTFILLLKGSFEAGLVGGMADWFAVTALFRHPLGIPIPHTSLLLKNKNKITRSLISAVENELLNKQSIEAKLRSVHVLETSFFMLAKLLSRKKTRLGILNFCETLLRQLPAEKCVPYLQNGLSVWLSKVDISSATKNVYLQAVRSGYDYKVIDLAATGLIKWLEQENTGALLGSMAYRKLSEMKSKGIKGFFLQAVTGFLTEDKLGVILQDLSLSAAKELMDEANPLREKLIQELRSTLLRLIEDEDKLQTIRNWTINQIQEEYGTNFLASSIENLRAAALERLEEERIAGGRKIFTLYGSLIRFIKSRKPEVLASMEDRLTQYLINLAASNHHLIGQLVKDNLDQMDDESLVIMLEEKLGKDLQWIRVNGALCGFILGFMLTLVSLMISR
ncbi:DUF445 domain-containing protein [Paenibacillus puldeungensis]|uniref:DUF445 domain-containing protein n=1 Tax=Paenibacillus puldeungensis TaxID=696536 RepID=A0ABW3RYB6_9BACL